MHLAKRSAALTLGLLALLVPGGLLLVIGLIWVYRKVRDRVWVANSQQRRNRSFEQTATML